MKKTTLFKVALALVLSTSAMFGQENFTKKLFGQTKEYEKLGGKNIIRCASTEYENYLQSKKQLETRDEFESWLAAKIKDAKKDAANKKQTNAVVTIPVVVHVLHTGQAVGTGANISDLRVQSQITVLNQDYRRMLGTNGYNNDANGADIEVEFCLVRQTPSGGLSNGINRVDVRQFSNTISFNESEIEGILKPRTIWDPTRYMNIWVGDFMYNTNSDLRGVLGYAQFPTGSTLPGLTGGSPTTANTDGVIIDWTCFGNKIIAPGTYSNGYDLGRTTTHEVGHYLGLRHVNGDNTNCTVDATDSRNDYCLDTPAQAQLHDDCNQAYDTCPSSPGLDNITNYMDYPADACLNKFTNDQKTRIRTVLLNSPRRASLLTSNTCATGTAFAKDLELIPSATSVACSQYYDLSIRANNLGSETITNATINYTLGNSQVLTYTFTGSIAPGGSQTINFTNIPFAVIGVNNLTFDVISVNGAADQDDSNDNKTLQISTPINVPTNAENSVEFYMVLDPFGSDNSFTVRNLTTNAIVASGGPYSDTPNQYNPQSAIISNLVNGNCYEIRFLDSENDGLLGDGFIGLYKPPYTNTDALYQTVVTGRETIIRFVYNFTLGTEDFNSVSSFGVYPNPANSILNISVGNQALPKAYTIFNTLGQVVKSKDINATSDLSINIESLAVGIYMIKVDAEKGSQTIKFIKK